MNVTLDSDQHQTPVDAVRTSQMRQKNQMEKNRMMLQLNSQVLRWSKLKPTLAVNQNAQNLHCPDFHQSFQTTDDVLPMFW